ncbi:MAG: hypothetical protein HOB45_09320 [Planctomycetaceae bacterium]|nr:hypothetical protein [Planctomycetaceae bacterium]
MLFAETFSSAKPISKPRWWPKRRAQWSVKDGALIGIAATEEYQQQRREIGHHLSNIPRVGMGKLPAQYRMTCRFQIDDHPGDAQVPLIEFGHHVSKIYFGKLGAVLLTNNEKIVHTRANEFQLKPFTWYTVLAEVGEEHLVVQLVDDKGKRTVFQAHDPQFATAKNMSFEMATTIQGTAKLNEIKVWSAGERKPDSRQPIKGSTNNEEPTICRNCPLDRFSHCNHSQCSRSKRIGRAPFQKRLSRSPSRTRNREMWCSFCLKITVMTP